CQGLPPGPARGNCVSDAAHGTGLCYACGPRGTDTGLCGTMCCGASEVCSSGRCVATSPRIVCSTEADCPIDPFGNPTLNEHCPCRNELDGGMICGASTIFSDSIGCASTSDCPANSFCSPFANGTLPGTCVAQCGSDPVGPATCSDGRPVCG